MAWYCGESVWYRGRRIEAMFRYDSLMSLKVAYGKQLELSRRDERKIKHLLRRQGKAKGPECDHGCGGPSYDDAF